ncbi:protein phosphatase 1 regulatory subunit 35 isoform X2 [Cottoperca gobio]|uniref:Protein phosphatase 1 regulatory subunit 35 isoform X2 n=1 Tax=Cottoperca gobio TaxID=56716 RepID=A0A6J2R690_COTGO|nr:protein phosphatase 1 regulatory subunit 35-like isoform X2 [Cottoperca gobio]
MFPVRMSSSSLLSTSPSPSPSPLPLPLPLPLPYSVSLTRCPELDLSVTLSPAPKTSHTHLKPSQQSDQSQLKTGRKGNIQVCFEEQSIDTRPASAANQRSEEDQRISPWCVLMSKAESHAPPQQPIRGQRRSRGCHHDPPAALSNQDPGHLERAGLNTTLALKAELQSLKGEVFNSQKSIQQTLERSERTKNLINTRATEEVNVSRSQLLFTSLVCVEVQEDQLISQVLQHRLPLPPSNASRAADEPSLLLFLTSDHVRQKPVPLEEEPVNYKPCPLTCPAYSTFDLYKRGRF